MGGTCDRPCSRASRGRDVAALWRIHYRFDSQVGLRMGRAVAALAIAREQQRGVAVFTSRVVW